MNYWLVLQTKPKQENRVHRQLAKAQFEVFFPQIRALNSIKPLFPSYLFVQVNPEDPTPHRLLKFTRGVQRVLGNDHSPQHVSNILIETLRERTRDGSLIEQELLFKEGDEVLVKKGILKDLRGIIERNLSEQGRVKVLFKWMSGVMRAAVRYVDLEKAA